MYAYSKIEHWLDSARYVILQQKPEAVTSFGRCTAHDQVNHKEEKQWPAEMPLRPSEGGEEGQNLPP